MVTSFKDLKKHKNMFGSIPEILHKVHWLVTILEECYNVIGHDLTLNMYMYMQIVHIFVLNLYIHALYIHVHVFSTFIPSCYTYVYVMLSFFMCIEYMELHKGVSLTVQQPPQ